MIEPNKALTPGMLLAPLRSKTLVWPVDWDENSHEHYVFYDSDDKLFIFLCYFNSYINQQNSCSQDEIVMISSDHGIVIGISGRFKQVD